MLYILTGRAAVSIIYLNRYSTYPETAVAAPEYHRHGYHNPGADSSDAEGYPSFYAPLSLASSASRKKEALMDIPGTLPPGQYVIYALIDPTDEKVYYVG